MIIDERTGKRGPTRRKERPARFNDAMKNKLYIVFILVVLACVGLIVRLAVIYNDKGDEYSRKVLSQQAYGSNTLVAERGDITDRNGVVLARSEKTYNVILDPSVILSKEYYLVPGNPWPFKDFCGARHSKTKTYFIRFYKDVRNVLEKPALSGQHFI
jgi:cell division protein FtsI/penicillin-binding protein 2